MQLRPRKNLPKPPIDGNEDWETDSSSEDNSDGVAGNGSDEEVYAPSSGSDGSSSSDDESDMFEETEILGAKRKMQNTAYVPDNMQMEAGVSGNGQMPGPPRASTINFHGSSKRIRCDYCPTKKTDRDGRTGPLLMWEVWEEEHEKWIDENTNQGVDSDQHCESACETAAEPSGLIMPLLAYQKEWLAWALKQEESTVRGGILADEMGMGKTIQAVALVLAKQEIRERGVSRSQRSCSSMNLGGVQATLVVCPVVAVSQWVAEIKRFTAEGSTRVLVHHGTTRGRPSDFSSYDFVITTYSTVEGEFRKYMMPKKKKRAGKDVRYDKNRSTNLEISEVEAQLMKKKSVLHSVLWDRIILDEAHYIKARYSNTAKAIFALDASCRWALSGTPLQNRVGELYSLVRFLQIVPYSYYLCKDCDCRTLHYRSSTLCSSCLHGSSRHFCWWNKYIANTIQAYGNTEWGQRSLALLNDKILKNVLLRRTKKGRGSDLALPPKIVTLRRDVLDVKEEDYYEALHNESQAKFNTYVAAGTVMNNYAHIFELLTRLRQAVDHPYLVVYSKTGAPKCGNTFDAHDGEQVCGICEELPEDLVVTSCSHVFCKACLIDFSASLGKSACPTCSRSLTLDFTAPVACGGPTGRKGITGFKSSSILSRIQLENFQTSTKIEALMEEIRCMVERDGSAKAIVFSQFTSFLELIEYSLFKSGVNCVQLVGSMSMAARDAAVKKFSEDTDCKIFLMSLKAGGVALNLTVASHVFLMDPWWNPAVEQQAQDRVHRIGQFKPIRIVRFVIENTIEDKLLQLQEKKRLVFEGTVGGSSEALGKLTEADLRFLFVS
ncbi:hypothetical protein Tsubulata_038330 [Turnera subulata]|uniref:DNA repair protein RAD16 n=1 Tax=Turnera subulata TaxID=218843 RepID=A0A9Q0FE81_9ROSI|nr:hypothetical protein Tsubulata_038330 [Turnera subulata]